MPLKLILVLFSLAMSLYAAEHWVRSNEKPRWQRVKTIEMINGVPTWRPKWDQTPVIRNTDCLKETVDDRADVVLVGDSIFYGVGTDPQQSLAPLLDRLLLARLEHHICTVNLAVPGYTFENERVIGLRDIPVYRPKVVVLEIWANSPHHFTMLEGEAFNFGSVVVDENGLPNPFGLSPALHRALFSKSMLWRKIIGEQRLPTHKSLGLWVDLVEDVDEFHEWLVAQDIRLVLAFATKLSVPWGTGRATEAGHFGLLQAWAAEKGVPTMMFADILSSMPVEAVRFDSCCHLNNEGTALVAEGIADVVAPLLAISPPDAPKD